MVTQSTSLTRSGVTDWLVQRISAVILTVYTLVLVGMVALEPNMGYNEWRAIFAAPWMRVFTLLAVAATCAHAWVGMWTIGSDYLREHTIGPIARGLRFVFQISVALIVIAYLLWGMMILWEL